MYLAASTAAGGLLACGVAVLAGWFALTGRITVGELIAVIGLAQFLMEPLAMLAAVPSWIAEARGSAERVALVIGAPSVLPEPAAEAGADTTLEVAGVRHGTLDGLDLVLRPGEFVGVVAYRPADAEALVGLLAGRVAPGEFDGDVRLGGVPLHDLRPARALLHVEPHHTDLFAGSLAANLAPGGADPEALGAALRAAAADEVVDAHPGGVEHTVDERGAGLSGGQRQRLALARALARPARRSSCCTTPRPPSTRSPSSRVALGVRALRTAGLTTLVVTSSPALLTSRRPGRGRRRRPRPRRGHACRPRHRRPRLRPGRPAMTTNSAQETKSATPANAAPTASAARPKNTAPATNMAALPIASARETWRWVRGQLRARPGEVAGTLAAGLLGAGAAVVPVAALGALVDRVRAGAAPSVIAGIGAVIGVAALVAGLMAGLAAYLVARTGDRLLATLREATVGRALRLPAATLERAGRGDLLARVGPDVAAVNRVVAEILPTMISSVLLAALSLATMAGIDWRLGLAGAVSLPLYAMGLRWYLPRSAAPVPPERAASPTRPQLLVESMLAGCDGPRVPARGAAPGGIGTPPRGGPGTSRVRRLQALHPALSGGSTGPSSPGSRRSSSPASCSSARAP